MDWVTVHVIAASETETNKNWKKEEAKKLLSKSDYLQCFRFSWAVQAYRMILKMADEKRKTSIIEYAVNR